jgi:agmatine deiminase
MRTTRRSAGCWPGASAPTSSARRWSSKADRSAFDGTGVLLTTEQCLLHPNRNPALNRDEIEQHLKDYLGVTRVVWLGQGLLEDKDTDGHVDLIAAFTKPGTVLLQRAAPDNPNHDNMAHNREVAVAAGLDVIDFDPLAYAELDDERIVASYMNFYVGARFVIVPTAGQPDLDTEALAGIHNAFEGSKEVIGVPGVIHAFGGGGPHCITQQVPALSPRGRQGFASNRPEGDSRGCRPSR